MKKYWAPIVFGFLLGCLIAIVQAEWIARSDVRMASVTSDPPIMAYAMIWAAPPTIRHIAMSSGTCEALRQQMTWRLFARRHQWPLTECLPYHEVPNQAAFQEMWKRAEPRREEAAR